MGLYNEVGEDDPMAEVADTMLDEAPCPDAPWPKQVVLIQLQLLEARKHLKDFYQGIRNLS